MKHETKNRRSSGFAKGSQSNAPKGAIGSENAAQEISKGDNETHETSVTPTEATVEAALPKDVNAVSTTAPISEQPETKLPFVAKAEIKAKTNKSVTGSKFVNRFGSKCIYAKRGDAMCTFSETAWKLLGVNKGGWDEVVPEPPEVAALKNK